MRRLALSAASIMLSGVAMAEDFPVPPIPPAKPPLGEAAPIPNFDATGPALAPSDEPSLYVRLYRNKMYDPSVGFVPGSQFQTSEDKKPIQTPGFSVSVPLK
ncbi:MAG TPA: hypothetical protein VGH29_19520 [Candidatus Binataceae bacterium]